MMLLPHTNMCFHCIDRAIATTDPSDHRRLQELRLMRNYQADEQNRMGLGSDQINSVYPEAKIADPISPLDVMDT